MQNAVFKISQFSCYHHKHILDHVKKIARFEKYLLHLYGASFNGEN